MLREAVYLYISLYSTLVQCRLTENQINIKNKMDGYVTIKDKYSNNNQFQKVLKIKNSYELYEIVLYLDNN